MRESGLWAMIVYRLGAYSANLPRGWRQRAAKATHDRTALMLRLATRSSLAPSMKAGEGLRFVHGFNVTIGPDVTLGERVEIMQDVTIASTHDRIGSPTVGSDVFIGAGATILGPVTIGDGAAIGANSLVTTDVPAGAFVIGVPAKVIRWGRAASAPIASNAAVASAAGK